MSIRNCSVIAIEGTHASGKTTLVHALTSHYRERGIHAACTDEPARSSPFIEEIVIHGQGHFDLETEIDLFAVQLTTLLRTARHHRLLIADKTIVNVLAYARQFVTAPPGSTVEEALKAMRTMCQALSCFYDAVFYCQDAYSPQQPGDAFRQKVAEHQQTIDQTLRDAYAEVQIPLIDIPVGLTTVDRVTWLTNCLAGMNLP